MDRKNRSSNFELMRIFAMLLIITYHYALFSNFRHSSGTLSFNRLLYQSMLLDGKTGVNLFVLFPDTLERDQELQSTAALGTVLFLDNGDLAGVP